ncbi:unnamed protein product [Lactuca virosa]|uniref:Uncharacterized protein n=1 Tax=Lactuca virosa TaxID=75947 RepID=A0AAU9NYG7_9ASTR|nr:unnamed protein product [Lactuca virosa]
MYPSLETKDLVEKLFADYDQSHEQEQQSTAFESSEEFVITILGLIVHSIDKQQSIHLASGVFEIICLQQGDNVITTLARVGDEIQWPLAKDEVAVKLEGSHYFFTLCVPSQSENDVALEDLLNYSLTITENSSDELDRVLEEYSVFSVKEIERDVAMEGCGSLEAIRVDDDSSSAIVAHRFHLHLL